MSVDPPAMPPAADARHVPSVLLCSFGDGRLGDVEQWLRQANYRTTTHRIADRSAGNSGDYAPVDAPNVAPPDFILIDAPFGTEKTAFTYCQSVRRRFSDGFVPITVVTDDRSPVTRAMSYNAGVDFHLTHPVEPIELLAQFRSLLRIKESYDRVKEQSAFLHRSHRRLELAYQQIDQELALAGKIQKSFMPQSLPKLPPARFAVRCQACGQVGGDFYDILPLEQDVVGFYVADAMGHGVPASLLTIYVKKGIVPRERVGDGYRLLDPGEVLERLNIDLLEQDLSENPFITMMYFALNLRTLRLDWAKAGHPPPLLLRPGEPPVGLASEGPILGIMESEYAVAGTTLRPGDRLLVYTDGIDGARYGDHRQGMASFEACVADRVGEPIDGLVESVYAELFADRRLEDDITLLGLEIDAA